ncbi:Coenzyme F420 hydrogenase/dehydrogenase, beta subunit C-terminal domain [Gaoshiqia sediminis]|uniref:Coenzyme F420 hydrogenase/dehydrogenase, beta subunit C-terminal domain n=1 Tax=Gaoshiqia sediminis TaxID=2986998 RepID=A0AA41Y7S4_9BACT|nr:Coenzyme F420 hydrogenase/dehydrogenase, beta subunit C-terminal domain [Gaoshiqia sediminis]MCW0482692.1 Coenzyme F420 hydrogenase/dehydrogenase, beta subunit C-terminal domain [Gaoshiqia sediminis]
MSNFPRVIELVVKHDLCTGCGVCVYQCPSQALEMSWNDDGFLIPQLTGNCESGGQCLDVCPFNPIPQKEVKTENEIAGIFLDDSTCHHPLIGRYNGIYVGYSHDYRPSSSSGGIATFLLMRFMEEGLIDYVISVKESQRKDYQYEYAISKNKEEVLGASTTKYYPVTLDEALRRINDMKGKVAITGVACFVKAIRLAQHQNPNLKSKIPFLIGIICGGIKSRFFTEYLAVKAGAELQYYRNPNYRIKDLKSDASDYYFTCNDTNTGVQKSVRMRSAGDMWGTGLFKANACDFCDDVTTELADISLGDAWLEPYRKDGKGNSLIVTRTLFMDNFVQKEINTGKLHLEGLSISRFISSQQGSYNHRCKGLSFRMKRVANNKFSLPPKRHTNEKISFAFMLVQILRMKNRKKSLEVWKTYKSALLFDKKMKCSLQMLKIATILYHIQTLISTKIRRK